MTRALFWKWSVRFFLVCVLAVAGAFWWLGGRLIAPAKCNLTKPQVDDILVERSASPGLTKPGQQTSVLSDVSITTELGGNCAGWYIPKSNAAATVILAHPLRSNRLSMISRAQLLNRLGYAVLLIDLQAHGESEGEHITFGYRESFDVKAAIEWTRRQSPRHKVAVLGRSLGGAAALLAAPSGIDALILESVYPTIQEATHNRVARHAGGLANAITPMLLLQLPLRLGISTDVLRPIDGLEKAGCPVLIMSGELDEHTTLDETQRMFDTAKQPKELALFSNAAHVDLYSSDKRLYEERLGAFLKRHLEDKSIAD